MASRVARFTQWMASRFANATPGSYTILEGFEAPVPNCFAYAVNVLDKAIRPDDWDKLAEEYARVGYYHIVNEPLEDGDVEVYAKSSDTNQPLHAHRVTDAAQLFCQSKMGEDLAIQHHRDLLQCARPGSTRYEYGTVVAHFRYDHDRYEKWREGQLTTSSGRVLKRKDVAWTSSGRPAAKNKVAVTKSGRITKKGSSGKRGGGKVRQAPSYTTSGKPDPRVVARQHPPAPPPGGFRRPTVRPICGHFPPVKAKRVAHPPPATAAKRPIAVARR